MRELMDTDKKKYVVDVIWRAYGGFYGTIKTETIDKVHEMFTHLTIN